MDEGKQQVKDAERGAKVVLEEVPGGFEAGTEGLRGPGGSHETRAGYFGRSKGDALLSMLCFEAQGTRNLALGVARDCERLLVTARAVAGELGIELNPNAPTTVYQETDHFGGGEVARLRERNAELQREVERLNEASR